MKQNLFYIIIGLICGILLCKLFTCGKCGGQGGVVKTDTIKLLVKDSTAQYTPAITAIEPGRIEQKIRYVPVPGRVDSFVQYEMLAVDTAAILKDYYARIFYDDPVTTKYGVIHIKDTVSKNRIASRKVETDFTIPVVTKTETVTLHEPKRNQVYIGLNAQGTKESLLTAVGPSIMLKTKGDKVFEVGALLSKNNLLTYQAGIKFKIKFK